jgi:hypothetical protein
MTLLLLSVRNLKRKQTAFMYELLPRDRIILRELNADNHLTEMSLPIKFKLLDVRIISFNMVPASVDSKSRRRCNMIFSLSTPPPLPPSYTSSCYFTDEQKPPWLCSTVLSGVTTSSKGGMEDKTFNLWLASSSLSVEGCVPACIISKPKYSNEILGSIKGGEFLD